jgi:hypothetical protein
MVEDKKDGLIKKFGKTAVKTGSNSAKGVIMGAVTGVATDMAKEGVKQVADATGLTKKTEETKGGFEDKLKKKESEVKKKIIKEAFKQSLK